MASTLDSLQNSEKGQSYLHRGNNSDHLEYHFLQPYNGNTLSEWRIFMIPMYDNCMSVCTMQKEVFVL